MTTKQAYQEKIEAQLREWQLGLDKLRVKAARTKAETKLEYQQQIDKEQNARLLAEKVMVENTGPAIRLTFQEMFEPSGISGTVTFYRPSDKSGDIVYEISLDSAGIQQFNTATLQDGKYILKIDYRVGGKLYFQEEPVYINIF